MAVGYMVLKISWTEHFKKNAGKILKEIIENPGNPIKFTIEPYGNRDLLGWLDLDKLEVKTRHQLWLETGSGLSASIAKELWIKYADEYSEKNGVKSYTYRK